MIISIREAYLGKKPLRPIEKHKWTLVAENGKILEDAASSFGISFNKFDDRDRLFPENILYIDSGLFVLVTFKNKTHWDINSAYYEAYYRPDIKLLFGFSKYSTPQFNKEAVLDYFSSKTLEELSDMGRTELPEELKK